MFAVKMITVNLITGDTSEKHLYGYIRFEEWAKHYCDKLNQRLKYDKDKELKYYTYQSLDELYSEEPHSNLTSADLDDLFADDRFWNTNTSKPKQSTTNARRDIFKRRVK